MDDEELMEHLLDILHVFYQQNSIQTTPIGKIRDVLERRTSQHLRLDQILRCGKELSIRGFIRVEGNQGKHPITGWTEAIILQNGIVHIHGRKKITEG